MEERLRLLLLTLVTLVVALPGMAAGEAQAGTLNVVVEGPGTVADGTVLDGRHTLS